MSETRPAWAERDRRPFSERIKERIRFMGYRPCPRCGAYRNRRPPHCPAKRLCPPQPE